MNFGGLIFQEGMNKMANADLTIHRELYPTNNIY
ncbi:MAG: hypothetical protein PWR04_332 [Anaerophaga sp.]|nr:hypothetical protein [Anaerophaga sp.]